MASQVTTISDDPSTPSKGAVLAAKHGITLRRSSSTALNMAVLRDGTVLDPFKVVHQPGDEPREDFVGVGRRWHFLNLAGEPLDPPAYLYQHFAGGFAGRVGDSIVPYPEHQTGPATREDVQRHIAEILITRGFAVLP